MNLVIVNLNGLTIIATQSTDDKRKYFGFKVDSNFMTNTIDEDIVAEFIARAAMDDLMEFNTGKGKDIISRCMMSEEEVIIATEQARYEQAVEKAEAYTTIQFYNRLRNNRLRDCNTGDATVSATGRRLV